MATEYRKATEENRIRKLIDEWANAIHAKDAEGVLSRLAEGFLLFSLAPPLQYTGSREEGKKHLEEWFSSFQGALGYEIRDLSITAGDQTAFSHSLNRMAGTNSAGAKVDLWFRQTLGFQQIDGEWKIIHQHDSVPFYMDGSGRAALDLKP